MGGQVGEIGDFGGRFGDFGGLPGRVGILWRDMWWRWVGRAERCLFGCCRWPGCGDMGG